MHPGTGKAFKDFAFRGHEAMEKKDVLVRHSNHAPTLATGIAQMTMADSPAYPAALRHAPYATGSEFVVSQHALHDWHSIRIWLTSMV